MLITAKRAAMLLLISILPAEGCWNSSLADAPTSEHPIVVELFTSQGCSSCPPADALLGELASRKDIIALGFHVDYWDSLGWRDRYSMPEATERQRRYVQALQLSSAFTPQIVIEGRVSLVGSDERRVTAAVAQAAGGLDIAAVVERGQLVITLPAADRSHPCDVDVVAYLPRSTTQVGRGENSGRALTEFNIVREFRRLRGWEGEATTLRVPVESFPRDADHVAVLVQQANAGPILGAAVVRLR